MDNDATDEERAQFEKVQAENRQIEDEWEREIAAAKGEPVSNNPLDGTDAHVELIWSKAEEDRNLKLAEQVRRDYPDFQDILDDYVVPYLRRNTRFFYTLKSTKNPALEAYALGLRLRQEEEAMLSRAREHQPARPLTQQDIDSMNEEQFEEALAETRKAGPEAASGEDEEYISKDEMRQMNELHPEGFAICLDWIKRNRGR
jgi:hypothetical protein